MNLTNCKNCGAPLKSDCDYCGTRYAAQDQRDHEARKAAMFNSMRQMTMAETARRVLEIQQRRRQPAPRSFIGGLLGL